jgi:hypothetical protein
MPKKLRPAVDLMVFKCRTLNVKMGALKALLMMNMQTTVMQDVETYNITINTSNLKMMPAGCLKCWEPPHCVKSISGDHNIKICLRYAEEVNCIAFSSLRMWYGPIICMEFSMR